MASSGEAPEPTGNRKPRANSRRAGAFVVTGVLVFVVSALAYVIVTVFWPSPVAQPGGQVVLPSEPGFRPGQVGLASETQRQSAIRGLDEIEQDLRELQVDLSSDPTLLAQHLEVIYVASGQVRAWEGQAREDDVLGAARALDEADGLLSDAVAGKTPGDEVEAGTIGNAASRVDAAGTEYATATIPASPLPPAGPAEYAAIIGAVAGMVTAAAGMVTAVTARSKFRSKPIERSPTDTRRRRGGVPTRRTPGRPVR